MSALASRRVTAQRTGPDGALERAHAAEVAVEHPVSLVYGNVPFAVMMASPADLEDFAVGFTLTERIVGTVGEIRAVALEETATGTRARIDVAGDRLARLLARRRNLSGRTGCGVCGIEDEGALACPPPARSPRQMLAPTALREAVLALRAHQPLHRVTRGAHAAAWCDPNGAIRTVREDVGRHNALDKLIGALARAGTAPSNGFILLTSRCSFELVDKAAAFGARTLVTVSAPTSLAIDRADALGIELIATAREDGAVRYGVGDLAPSLP